MNRIIMIKGPVETLSYFSMQMALYYRQQGYDIFFWDMYAPLESRESFDALEPCCETALITFNFIGLSGESQFEYEDDESIFDAAGIRKVCIMVDHPMYYEKQITEYGSKITMFCVDRDHCKYIERYFGISGVGFCPLAGTFSGCAGIPLNEREIDVLFAGNYVSLEGLKKHLEPLSEEFREYMLLMAEDLIANPSRTIEEEAYIRLNEDFPDSTFEEQRDFMHNMVFVDLYVRSFYRRKVILELAGNGIRVDVIGKDWELAGCSAPENIVSHGIMDSQGCIDMMRKSRVSINVMPWFKNGTHDRIYNSLFNGCALVTDSSEYLDEMGVSRWAYTYSLTDISKLPDIVREILNDIDNCREIKGCTDEFMKDNSWEARAEAIAKWASL